MRYWTIIEDSLEELHKFEPLKETASITFIYIINRKESGSSLKSIAINTHKFAFFDEEHMKKNYAEYLI